MGIAVWYYRRHRQCVKTGFMGWGIGIRELDFTGLAGTPLYLPPSGPFSYGCSVPAVALLYAGLPWL